MRMPYRRCFHRAASALLLMMSLLATSSAPAVAAPAELLTNPGFEGTYAAVSGCANISGEVAPGWNDNTCWEPSAPVIRYARDAQNPHSGSSAQRVELVSGARAQFVQYLAVEPAPRRGQRVAVWLRSAAPMFLKLQLRQSGDPYRSFGNLVAQVGTGWSKHEFDAVTLGAPAMLIVAAEQPGVFWVDDASLVDTGAVADLPPANPARIDASFFGMHFNDLDTPWPELMASRIGSVRIWDAGPRLDGSGTGAQWSEVNPQSGVYDWTGLDQRVAAARSRNAELVYTLGGRTPRWASATPAVDTPYGPGQCGEPASDAIWQDWVRAVATRYLGSIRVWEIWNEPDLPAFYCGNPLRLVDLARQARAVVKSIDPTALIVSPAISGLDGPGYLDLLLTGGLGPQVDVIGAHFYVVQPEDVWQRVVNLRSVMAKHGVQRRPLWNTEQGFYDDSPPLDLFPQPLAAALVARTHLLGWAWGLGRYHYYTWDNAQSQVRFTQADRRTLTEAGIGYQQLASWLVGATMVSLTRDAAGTYIAELKARPAAQRWVVWNPDRSVVFTPPAAWNVVRQVNLLGGAVALGSGVPVTVGSSPLLLEGGRRGGP